MGMYGPEYVWILNPEAGTVDRWAELNRVEALKNKSVCTKEELEVVANRTFLLAGNDLRSDNDTKTDSGLVRKTCVQKAAFQHYNTTFYTPAHKDKIARPNVRPAGCAHACRITPGVCKNKSTKAQHVLR